VWLSFGRKKRRQEQEPAKRRSDFGKRHKHPEHDLQVACVKHTRELGLIVVGSPRDSRRDVARGCESGTADLLVLRAGHDGSHGLAVELKIKNNHTSQAQKDWAQRIMREGWQHAVVYSLEEFTAVLSLHMSGTREPTGTGTGVARVGTAEEVGVEVIASSSSSDSEDELQQFDFRKHERTCVLPD
jgi:hypothetical protein